LYNNILKKRKIKKNNVSMSSKYNVKIIIVKKIRVILLR